MTTAAYPQSFFKNLKSALAASVITALSVGFASSSFAMYVAPYSAKLQAGNSTGQLILPSPTEQLNLQLAAYDEFISQNTGSTDQSKLVDVASVYFNKGKLLSENRRNAEAQAQFDALITRFAGYQPAEMQVAYAYLGRMLLQSERGEAKPALATADELLKRFSASANPSVRETVAKTLLAKSSIYAAQGQYKQAAVTNRLVIQRYSADNTPASRLLVAQAYADQIIFQARLQRIKNALSTFDEALAFMNDAADMQQYRAFAYFNRGVAYRAVDDYQSSLQAYDQMLAQFADSQQASIRNLLASAYSNQAETLVKLERYDQAQAVVDQALVKFTPVTDMSQAEAVATLYNNKGFLLFAQSKQQWPSDKAAALLKLQQARQNYEKALSFRNIPGMSYSSLFENYAYTMYLLGDSVTAQRYLAKALQVGTQVAYQAALDDINMHAIPEDAGFKALLQRLWQEQQRQK